MKPMLCTPIYNQTIWAGDKLNQIRKDPNALFGTSWEVSAHPSAETIIGNGEYKGQELSTLIAKYPIEMLGEGIKDNQMLRSAWLDAKESLSVQVHPGEAYAQANENDHGKTESWYVLKADEGATLVAGSDFNEKDEIRNAISNDTIESHLRRVPVKDGDFILIPAGTLHALGKGILAIEIGTNSNTTYRFYDYHRKDQNGNERELHLEKSLDVVNLEIKPEAIHTAQLPSGTHVLCHDEAFDVSLTIGINETVLPKQDTFRVITSVGDESITMICDDEEILVKPTQSLFIPASCNDIKCIGNVRLLIGTVK